MCHMFERQEGSNARMKAPANGGFMEGGRAEGAGKN